jgi:hypothetical protein
MNKESTYAGFVNALAAVASAGQSVCIRPAFDIPGSSLVIVIGSDHYHLDNPAQSQQITAATNWINQCTTPQNK